MAWDDLEDIEQFLRSEGPRYLKVLEKVKEVLRTYCNSPSGRRKIYRLATRADYQHGRELKTPQSVWNKIRGRKEKCAKDSNLRPYTSCFDLADLVAMRLICVYPSDVPSVIEDCLRTEDKYGHAFRILPSDPEEEERKKKEREDSGFQGKHFAVSLKAYLVDLDESTFDPSNHICEIQVLTMLEETWSSKGHDLIYKGEYAQESDRVRSRLLSRALSVIDDQSELLKQQIHKTVERDKKRKHSVKIGLHKAMLLGSRGDDEKSTLTRSLAERLLEQEERLRDGDVIPMIGEIEKYRLHYGIDTNFCRLIELLAVMRETDDLDAYALDQAEKLIAQSTDTKARWHGQLRKGVVCFSFDRGEQAIEETRKALDLAREMNEIVAIGISKANLSYFIADFDGRRRVTTREFEAREYVKEVLSLLPQIMRGVSEELRTPGKSDEEVRAVELETECRVMDTNGYVEIMFGKDVEAVKRGWRLCVEACEKRPGKDAGSAFLAYHESRAFEKLLELS
jgi:ppGpp synthetase/RelA/SpoT-type nucleotidyltranferase